MPNLFDCLESAVSAGLAPAARARAAQSEYRELVAQLETAYPTHVAQALAGQRLAEATKRSATSRRHAVLNQLSTMQRNAALVAKAADPSTVAMELIEGRQGTGNTFESVRFVREALRGQLLGMISDVLQTHGPDIVGRVRNRVQLLDLVRELHGQASGNAEAKRMADAVRAAQTRARTLFNAYGGDIGELADFGMPHAHETGKVRAAGFGAWRDSVLRQLDWSRIEDAATGKPFAQAGQLPPAATADRFLRDVYDGIVTRDWDERTPSMGAGGGGALYNQRADPRVLHFRDADAWLAYNDRFGAANPFQAIVTHLEGMARDVAQMRVLGPNPKAGLEHAIQTAQKRVSAEFENHRAAAGADPAALERVAKDQQRAEKAMNKRAARGRAMLASVTGASNVPEDETLGAFFAGTRNVLTSAQLGSAMLSASTDLWTMRMAGKAVGMNPGNLFSRQVSLLTSHATRETAAAMGYVADTLANGGSAAARYLGDVWSPEITARITDTVLRASGLSFWTDMNRTAFRMEFAAHLASQVDRGFADIDAPLRKVLADRGVTAAEWDKLRDPAALFQAPNGSKFLSPLYWLEATSLPRAEAEGLSLRLQAIIDEQLEFAVPSVTLEGRAMLLGETRPGSFSGELLRSGLMYKSYGLSVFLNQWRRIMDQPTGLSRARYAASMMVGLTLFGALSIQLKQLAAGRDPRPMENGAFWGAAVFQGGGLGILGDFLTSETSRVGGGLAETLAGPVVGAVADVVRLGEANVASAAAGKPTHVGRDAVNLARRYTPGSSLWQIRLGLDRLVWDQLQRVLDPEAKTVWREQSRKQERDFGNANWWERGELTPDRAPDLTNIGGSE